MTARMMPPPELRAGRTPASLWPEPLVTSAASRALCPDLLRIEDIGEADGWRGRLVRGFFWALKRLTGV